MKTKHFIGLGLGALCGIFCWWSAIFFLEVDFTVHNLIFLVLNRMGLGLSVASATDSLNLPWYLRGPLVAFIIGLCVTYFDYFMGYGWTLTIVVNFMSISYGFMIDGILTHFFKGETN